MTRRAGFRSRAARRRLVLAGSATLCAAVLVPAAGTAAHAASTRAWPADVFAVGTYDGVHGQFGTSGHATVADIQSAVDAAQAWARANTVGGTAPDTYVLLAPGDYKTVPTAIEPAPPGQDPSGVLVTGDNVWIVGMNRNSVVVDGTKSGPPCSTETSDQVFGPPSAPDEGLNGVMFWRAAGTWAENFTTCNFLDGPGADGGTGNEVWWNGRSDAGTLFVDKQGGFGGTYLTATSTYFDGRATDPEATAATYGIFSSAWDGGFWDHTYASNFNDSGYYIGQCRDACNQVVDHAWAEDNALGYSGSNSGGRLLVENSRFDNNEDGFDTNSQNGDDPPPQDGACPPGVEPPVPGAATCWVFYRNTVDHNNNPDVPTYGSAAAGPVGTGMSLSGGRDDTVLDNTFSDNGAWGNILVPYPDSGPPCTGGTYLPPGNAAPAGSPSLCLYDEWGDAVVGNHYAHNGFFGNPTNGDIAATNLLPGPTDCFSGNTDGRGLTTSPPEAELLYPSCTGRTTAPDLDPLFLDEVACDSGSISIATIAGSTLCPPGSAYPRQTKVVMHALPGAAGLEEPSSTTLPTMPDVCHDLPANPWCPSGHAPATAHETARSSPGSHGTPALGAERYARSRRPSGT